MLVLHLQSSRIINLPNRIVKHAQRVRIRNFSAVSESWVPRSVKIVEVGPRDGLQSEKLPISLATKIKFIDKLSKTGLTVIESGSFVSAKAGLEAAVEAGAKEVAVFASASDAFCIANTRISMHEGLENAKKVTKKAINFGCKVRGYVSCVLGCPYEGNIEKASVAKTAVELYESGCYEISLGDTIGVGTPLKTKSLVQTVSKVIPVAAIAGHFHNTYGQALANTLAALEEDGMGIETGVDINALIDAGEFIMTEIGRPTDSLVAKAMLAKR
eukprot:GSMAST32.ASY1.ANO1.1622.1 assembled CDS